MPLPLFTVDAFTDKPFRGNPAGVCVLSQPAPADWMQAVATEMNLAETAFLWPLEDGYSLRWFTPTVEVDLCGHATLASAHVLWTERHLAPDRQARFHTRSGLLTADRRAHGIELNFPSEAPNPVPEPPAELSAGLGTPFRWCGRNRMDYLVELESAAVVRRVQPDFVALARLPVRGVIVTAPADVPEFDFVSRFFAPATGVPEDPVTGSAHCCLGPFWQERLGKAQMRGLQVSPRQGIVQVCVLGDRVLLSGQAVLVLRAQLLAVP